MAPKNPVPAIGEVFEVPYPFVHDTRIEHYDGADGPETDEVPTWNPGVRTESCDVGNDYSHVDYWSVADGMGAQIITVVGIYRPSRFPTRVFFTRRWRDPDGKEFGKTKCRMTTVPAFRVLCGGYRHQFELLKRGASHRLGESADAAGGLTCSRITNNPA